MNILIAGWILYIIMGITLYYMKEHELLTVKPGASTVVFNIVIGPFSWTCHSTKWLYKTINKYRVEWSLRIRKRGE